MVWRDAILFTRCPVNGRLGFFHLWATANNATVNQNALSKVVGSREGRWLNQLCRILGAARPDLWYHRCSGGSNPGWSLAAWVPGLAV